MEKKAARLADFKQALISTIKSISEKNDFEISFGKQASKDFKNVYLPDIKKLENFYFQTFLIHSYIYHLAKFTLSKFIFLINV